MPVVLPRMLATRKSHRRRWPRPPTIWTLVLMTATCALYLALFLVDRKTDELWRVLLVDLVADGIDTYGPGQFDWPIHTRWLHRLLADGGDGYPTSLGSATFGPYAYVDRGTVEKLLVFEELEVLVLDGELHLQDEDVVKLGFLKNLYYLHFSDALVSKECVERIEIALPQCEIEWNDPN